MQNLVKEFIEKTLETNLVLEKPKDITFGHYATPVAFSLAKELKKYTKIFEWISTDSIGTCSINIHLRMLMIHQSTLAQRTIYPSIIFFQAADPYYRDW